MAITISNGFITKLQMASDGSFNILEDFNGTAGFISASAAGGAGGGGGVGAWYFYSDEGTINAVPPIADGNAIFTINAEGPTLETFNPNETGGVTYLYFNVKDSSGTDYTTQFNTLASDGIGTITISQNGDTATYVGSSFGSFMIETLGGGSFFMISTAACTQTKSSNNSYVFADPISITIS